MMKIDNKEDRLEREQRLPIYRYQRLPSPFPYTETQQAQGKRTTWTEK